MKRRHRNPTLVHHRRARAASYHVVDPNGNPVAEIYVSDLAQAQRIARGIANARGAGVLLLDNRQLPKRLSAHPSTRIPISGARRPVGRRRRNAGARPQRRSRSSPRLARGPRGQFLPRQRASRSGTSPKRRARRNPGTTPLAAAARTYRKWHGFGHAAVVRAHVRDVPPALVKLGDVHAIEYLSNKWGRRQQLYRHVTHKPKPRLYTGPEGRGYHIVGGAMRTTERGLVH